MSGNGASWIDDVVRPGDLVVVAQGTGEPSQLLRDLVEAAERLRDVEVFVGLSHSGVLTDERAGDLRLVSFGAMGPLSPLASRGRVAIIPCHFADVPRLLERRAPGRLVLALQVSPADADGCHSLGLAVDYTWDLLGRARAVVAEVNDHVPVTSAPRIAAAALSATVETSHPLPAPAEVSPTEVHRAIAAHVAALVPDHATLQLGVGSLPHAVGQALAHRRGLRVWSTLVGDWLLTLTRAGALDDDPGAVVISEAAGSPELGAQVVRGHVQVRPVSELNRPGLLARLERFVAVNSALQVDLTGQVNAEELGDRYVGGIGGQPDFLRAAQRSPGGLSVVMLPATAARGSVSRIVTRLHGDTVTTPRSSVDVVVTEHGTADLRGRSLAERAAALTAIAAPHHRPDLRSAP